MAVQAFALFPDLDGESYLASRTVAERRLAGAVYTPPQLVRLILDHAGYKALPEQLAAPFLDPACGAGAFLIEAVDRVASAIAHEGVPLTARRGHRLLLDRVGAHLFGVDLDPTACELARLAVRERVQRLTGEAPPPRFFDSNVVKGDFLRNDVVEHLPALEGGLGFVVGNPPYVQTTRLTATVKDRLRARFATAFGRIDLYALFMERALQLLEPGGVLAFITPDKYLTGKSMQPLRALILDRSAVRRVTVFRSHKVFKSAATVPCITVLENGARSSRVRIAEGVRDGDRIVLSRRATVSARDRLKVEGWNVLHPTLLALSTRIRAAHPLLLERAKRISAGYATGRDKLFVFSTDGGPRVEPELLHSALRGRDIGRLRLAAPRLAVLLPYTFSPSGEARLVEIERFPRAMRYLAAHRDSLEARHCVREWSKAWYDLHDPVTLDLTRTPKILVPDLARRSRFAFDPGEHCPLHSAYYVIPNAGEDPWFLTGVLNSRPLELLVQLAAPVVKDGFRRYRRQFLADLPIPDATDRTRRAIATAARANDMRRVDALAARLFEISRADEVLMDEYLQAQAFPCSTPGRDPIGG